jgi:pseudouridine synthase, rluA family
VTEHLAAAGISIATSGAPERQGVVSRLDVGTSGLMVLARSERAYSVLKQAFRDKTVDKTYLALVQGHPDPFSGTIDAPIGRHPGHEWKMAIMEGGRESITHYEAVEAHRAATLVEVRLETGRTHQIRVHFAAIGHPCCGDPLYGSDPVLARQLGLERQWLHAHRLGFQHPVRGEYVEFESTPSQDLQNALHVVRSE